MIFFVIFLDHNGDSIGAGPACLGHSLIKNLIFLDYLRRFGKLAIEKSMWLDLLDIG